MPGVWTTISYSRSEFIQATDTFLRSMVSAALIAMPDFQPPLVLAGYWMFAKWVVVDAAEYITSQGIVTYKGDLFTAGWGRVYECPSRVSTQQIAEMYGVSILVKYSANRRFSRVTVFQDSMQAVSGSINLRARTRH